MLALLRAYQAYCMVSFMRYVLLAAYAIIWVTLVPSSWTDPLFFFKDASDYTRTAQSLLTNGTYSLDGLPFFEREPGYSVFLAIIYAIFGVENRLGILMVQGALFACASWVFVCELSKITSQKIGTITLGFLLLSPSIIRTIFSVLRENFTLSIFLFLLTLWLAYARAPNTYKAFGMALLFSIVGITYFSYAFLPLFLLPLFWKMPREHRAMILLLPALILSLWGVRNLHAVGEFRIIGPFRAAAMWYGRAEQAKTLRGLQPFECVYTEYITHDWNGPPCTSTELRHIFRDTVWMPGYERELNASSFRTIGDNFAHYLWGSLAKTIELHLPNVGFWGRTYNYLATAESVILIFGCIGGLFAWRKLVPFIALITYATLNFSLTEALPRFHMPIMFAYIVIAAVGYASYIERLQTRTNRQ